MAGPLQSLFRMWYGARMQPFAGIPGPTPSYPLGTLGDFLGKDAWDVMAGYARQYGGMTMFWMLGTPTLILNDASLIRDVLVTRENEYYKDYPIKALGPVLRNTLFNLNGAEWSGLRQAHPCNMPRFTPWLQSQFSIVQQVTERHLTAMLQSAQNLELIDKFQRLLFDVFNSIVCGPDFVDGGFDNFYELSKMATFRMGMPQPLLLPPLSPVFHRAMKLHYGAYARAVEQARQNPRPEANDLLSIFLRSGTGLSDRQIVDFLSEFQAGGDISAASAIVNTLYLLNAHPAIATRLGAQLLEARQRNGGLTPAALEEVPLLDHVLRESLRLIPPVRVFGRNVRKDQPATLGGRQIPPDTVVMILPQAVQRDPAHWPDPDTFNPSRWENGVVEANPVGSDYFFPFGRGPRMCMGAETAMFCMKIVLGTILSQAAVATSGSFRGVLHCGVVESKELLGRMMPYNAG